MVDDIVSFRVPTALTSGLTPSAPSGDRLPGLLVPASTLTRPPPRSVAVGFPGPGCAPGDSHWSARLDRHLELDTKSGLCLPPSIFFLCLDALVSVSLVLLVSFE